MASTDKIYYLAKPGASQQEGPYSEQDLYALYASRQLPPGSKVWAQGWSDWKPCELVFQWCTTQPAPASTPGASTGKIYYLVRSGASQQEGPYSEQELQALYTNRQLPPGSKVWAQGWSDWKPCELVFQWCTIQPAPVSPPPMPSNPVPPIQAPQQPAYPTPVYPVPNNQAPQPYNPGIQLSFKELLRKYFITVVKEKFADFSGRATRQEFLIFSVAYFLVGFICGFMPVIGNVMLEQTNELGAVAGIVGLVLGLVSLLGSLVLLGLFVPGLAVSVRRCHDIGWSGWMVLLCAIPLVGCVVSLMLCIQDSQRGTNQYGPSEKYPY